MIQKLKIKALIKNKDVVYNFQWQPWRENFTSLKVSYPPYKTAKIVNDMNRKYSRNLFRKPVFKKKKCQEEYWI